MKDKELKTLKDINGLGYWNVNRLELRREAVEWVKVKFNLSHTIGCGFHADKGWLEFMEFFNLTEEDLSHSQNSEKGLRQEVRVRSDTPKPATQTQKVIEAMKDYWGERCLEFDSNCACCQAWGEFDKLKGANN